MALQNDAGAVAPFYLRATHPEHGEPVVFVPGELLPVWAAALLQAGNVTTDDDGVVVLVPPKGKAKR
jgi:hypothetical protein